MIQDSSVAIANQQCVWEVENVPSELSRGRTIGAKFFANNNVTIDVLRPHIMPVVTPSPSVISWVPIPRNMPSQALRNKTHIPYLGEEAAADGFIDGFIDLHQTDGSENRIDLLDDDTFIKLVQALIKYQRNTNSTSSTQSPQGNESVTVNETSNLPDETIIFQSINECFTGQTNADHLREK